MMERDGSAIVYCQGAFGTPNGKTAHGLIRLTNRYRVLSVIDARHEGADAGAVLDGRERGIPVFASIGEAVNAARGIDTPATHLVIGLAPDGGRLESYVRRDVIDAIQLGLNIDSGLHDFLSENDCIAGLADRHGVRIRDVRRTPPRSELHFFSGKIEEVSALKIAVLGTDSAVGKRTTAWMLTQTLQAAGCTAEMVGTGQTAWMQGVRHGIILDSLVNDFVSGEIEHAVWTAWKETDAVVIVIEGQGSLLNPAYPGGFEILAAGRPDLIVLQHAPARKDYDGFPGYPIHPLEKQIRAVELISDRPVAAITVNHENLEVREVARICDEISRETGLPACDVTLDGAGPVASVVMSRLEEKV